MVCREQVTNGSNRMLEGYGKHTQGHPCATVHTSTSSSVHMQSQYRVPPAAGAPRKSLVVRQWGHTIDGVPCKKLSGFRHALHGTCTTAAPQRGHCSAEDGDGHDHPSQRNHQRQT